MKKFLALTLLLGLACCGGCASTSPLRTGATRWSNAHIPSYVRYVLSDPMYEESERAAAMQDISGLPCLLEEVQTSTATSPACACSKESDRGRREVACMAWARTMIIGGVR